MNRKVDKFFKEKLEGDSLSPSPQAWEKLEAQLVKKNKRVVVYRVAAVLAVFGLLTFILINRPANNEEQPALTKNNVEKKEVPAVANKDKKKPNPPMVTTKKAKPQKPVERATPEKLEAVDDKPKDGITTPVESLENPTLAEAVPSIREEKRIVLVYSLPTVVKKQSLEFELADEKKSGIQKVFEAAKDVKNSDNPLGELREAKNDLFALDFKRDKDKSKKQ